ncbi:hypothetical protein CAP48_19595 (plasmid) [Advenella sp. S44]|uniref:DNA-binding protein n=1 Tax=Advenella sp. S44 TaxID=1982755 RepID=UPI000C298548|nr:DNA-binding protein [Advenella sp. S44]PJX20004.1 hypothetical protein CAP48_19595 [Advenella sp. S44]
MAITKSDIWKVADALDAEGIRPTLAAVRKKLGSGSYTTISDAMSEWKNRKAEVAPSPEPAPTEVIDQLTQAGNVIWAIALTKAQEQLTAERERIEAERQDIAQGLAETVELADSLTLENDRLRERVEQLEPVVQERNDLAGQLANLERRSVEELNRCKEMLAAKEAEANAAHKEAKEASQKAANMQGQIEALKEQFSSLTIALKPEASKK